MRRVWYRALVASLALLAGAVCASDPPPRLAVPDGQLWAPGSRVHPNVLLNLSLTFADAGAAYRGPYLRAVEYAGYFNPRMCYRYPMRRIAGASEAPELDERSGHFSIEGAADAQHQCGGAFSGNFLNWATASTLDLLRAGLTGGDRVIDHAGLTVLQRAWLPDGAFHPDFYAHPQYFPRKSLHAGGAGSSPADVTPFAADTLYIVSCRNRVLFSQSATGGNCDTPRHGSGGRLLVSDKNLGEFNVRVAVCMAADAAGRPELCRAQARGFKPEGALQRAGARIGVMSYLTEHGAHDANRYGGVLRAPLKFLGATGFEAPDFAPQPNRRAEWSPVAGVLAPNPDGASGAVSGAINYINLLGRSAPSRRGAYAIADPGAELFYEALRYLQGRAPGVRASAADDGLPVWQTRTDPVSATCQRNVIATIGHASFTEDRYLPGNTRVDHLDAARAADPFAPVLFDVMQSARRVGALEASAPRAPRPDLRRLDTLDDGPALAGSYYLAGAAYWAHTNAIRADKPLAVDSFSLELGEGARARGSVLYLSAKYGAFDDANGDANPFITSGKPSSSREWSADGSTPAHYFSGADPHAIVPGVRAMLAGASAPRGRLPGAAVVANAGRAGAYLILASFDQAHWSGTVQRVALRTDAQGSLTPAPEPLWDAAERLDGNAEAGAAPHPAPAARNIYTLAVQPDVAPVTVPFKWDRLTPGQRAALDGAPAADGLGEARTAYLRGERARELGMPGGAFRRRASVLGDAIHNVPLLVGAPSAALQDDAYPAFYAAHKKRRAAVYVGANDGMLHAFDAADGAELFAYVPNALVPALAQLASPGYQHRPYVDGSAGHGEALVGGRWRTVLASGMGMGARGVFALDITDPAAFDAGMGALWEFTDKDDPAMGHVRAAPQIARFKVGSKGERPVYRYFAVVASGVNSDERNGALFLLALDKPAAAKWKNGDNYYRLEAPVAEPSAANALAAPALVIGADGSVLYAYAGDLQGSLWRFDFTGKPPWGAAGAGSDRRPLFVARDAAGQRQPIMHAPAVVFAPGGGYLVLFGTGRMLEFADLLPANFAPQSLYAVHDALGSAHTIVRGRAELEPRTLAGARSYAVAGKAFAFSGPRARKGWYFDFPRSGADGERSARSAVLAGGAAFIDTLAPGAHACAAPVARSYVVDALSGFAFDAGALAQAGAETGSEVTGNPGAAPVLLEMSPVVGPRNPTGGALVTRTFSVVRVQDGGAGAARQVKASMPARRMSWREIANWQELHDAATAKK